LSAQTAIHLWAALAIIGGVASFFGLLFSATGLNIAWRRWFFQGTEGIVAKRDIFMLASLTIVSLLLLSVSGGLVYLSTLYPEDLYAVLHDLAIPVFLCYLGFAGASALNSLVSPIWVISRIWALQKGRDSMLNPDPTPKPSAAEWCETDPKVITTRRHGENVQCHVTYFGLTTPDELRKILAPAGIIDRDGNLFVSISGPDYPWYFSYTLYRKSDEIGDGIYGNQAHPLIPSHGFNFTLTLQD
jgi:hypothetical protein